MSVPFRPRSIGEHVQRYALALERCWVPIGEDDFPGGESPSNTEANIFDFAQGVRLVIWRGQADTGTVSIHVLAALCEDSPIYAVLERRGGEGLHELHEMASGLFALISGFVPLHFTGVYDVDGHGVPHWVGPVT
jgi:hypothetical protein